MRFESDKVNRRGAMPRVRIARWTAPIVCGWCVAALATPWVAGAEAPAKVTYEVHVRPIFQQHCFACHSQDDKSSDLALDSFAAAMEGGAGGEVLAAGDLDGSRLWRLVNHLESPEMPPGQDKLEAKSLGVLKAWIEGGLLENAGSVAKPAKNAALDQVAATNDNRPTGDPAMPQGLFREPLVYSAHPAAVGSLAVSPWAPLAAVPSPRQVALYQTETGELLGILPYPEGVPHVVRFSRNGDLLVVAGGHDGVMGNAAVFDVPTGARLATLGEEVDAVLAADISPDHALVALGGPKKVVRVYRVADGSLAYEIRKHTDWITAVQFSPDGKLLATADRSGGLLLWAAAAGHERADLRGHQEQVTALSWRTDSQVLASASEDDTVRLWQPDGKQLKSIAAHVGGVLSVEFSREAALVTAGRDSLVKSWAPDGKHLKDVAKFDDVALAACFTHEGTGVLASDWQGRVQLFDVATGAPGHAFAPNPPTLEQRVARAAEELSAATASASQAQSEATEAKAKADAAEQSAAALQDELAAVIATIESHGKNRVAAAAVEMQAAEARRMATAAATEAAAAWTAAETAAANAQAHAEADRLRVEWEAAEAALTATTAARQKAAAAVGALEKSVLAARNKLAMLVERRQKLPDTAALRATADTRSADLKAAQSRLDQSTAVHAAAVAEAAAFKKAGELLAAEAAKHEQRLAAEQGELAAVVAVREDLAAELAQHEAAAKKVADEIAALRDKQSRLAAKAAAVAERLKAQGEQVEHAESQQRAASRRVALDAALRAQLESAAAVRAKYAEAADAK